MVRLESVRRTSGGRIHLTPRIPKGGPVTTLCGQVLGDGAYAATDAVADCANCIRRSRDQSRISSAFFEQDEGSELLKLSLEHARQRRPEAGSGAPAAERKPELKVVKPAPPPTPPPEEVGELVTEGFKASGQGVWRSPDGVIVRMAGARRDRFAELVYDGEVVVRRDGEALVVRAGDVEIRPQGDADGVEVRIRRR
jgi:hypothetical protein